MSWPSLRSSEWILVGFFAYITAISPLFRDRPHLSYQPAVALAGVLALFSALARFQHSLGAKAIGIVRDWLPIPLTLMAFREMELFLTSSYARAYESAWIRWDDLLLRTWHLRGLIEYAGKIIPFYLELCYLLVYGVGAFCVVVLYVRGQRGEVNRFWSIYLVGTLAAYALFPCFPSQPPRIAFPAVGAPSVTTWVRELNMSILRHATIHSGVFPSAHVSSAFSCAWGMFLVLPERRRFGWGLLLYAFSVSVATIYGRYHYAADVVAGFGISLVAGIVCIAMAERHGS
ncbi:MAG TPA: phosphatase PAP2 family protein [Bryobacteraceae bacterium]|nr:phosphatase PAP2 family protein [Bryobacteraceae bacterium]